MGRDEHKSSSNSKNTLPQTQKSLKIPPGRMKEETASEFAEIGTKALKVLNKSTHQKITPVKQTSDLLSK